MKNSTDWRTSQRTYPAVHGTNQLAVTPEEFDEALEAYAALHNREILSALKVAQHSLRAWNAMGMSGDAGKQVAAAYENSPEMKAIAVAIAKVGGK